MLRYSIMVFIGLFAIVTGLVVFFLLADATRNAILDEVVIDSKTHKNYEKWTTDWDVDDQALYFTYYLFNLTNPTEWASGAAKANFAEIGPFTYRRYTNKTNPVFNNGGDDVTYSNHNEYVFQSDRSVSNDKTTMIYNVNPFAVAAIQAAGTDDNFNANLAVAALAAFDNATEFGSGSPTSTTTPGFFEAMQGAIALTDLEATSVLSSFSGNVVAYLTYKATIAAYNNAVSAGAGAATIAGIAQVLTATYVNGPDFSTTFAFPNLGSTTKANLFIIYVDNLASGARASLAAATGASDKLMFRNLPAHTHLFGPDPFFYAVTGQSVAYFTNHSAPTATGKAYTVKTGKSSSSEAGMDHFIQANGVNTSTAYVRADGSGPTVVVNGRVSSMAPFQGATPDKITTYFEETEQYYSFTFNGVQEIEGIETARYLADIETITALNAPYNITIAGFAPMQYFASGVPFFLSLPHQRYSVPPQSTAITGMSPSPDAQNSYLDLEPITGSPLEARLCVQNNLGLNFSMHTYADIPSSSEKDVMVPLYWFNKNYRVNAEAATSLKLAVVTAVILRRAILGTLVGLGVVCVLIGAALMVQKGGNDGVNESDKNIEAKKAESAKQQVQESELPPDNEPELQPFNPPPPVGEDGENGQEMQQVAPV